MHQTLLGKILSIKFISKTTGDCRFWNISIYKWPSDLCNITDPLCIKHHKTRHIYQQLHLKWRIFLAVYVWNYPDLYHADKCVIFFHFNFFFHCPFRSHPPEFTITALSCFCVPWADRVRPVCWSNCKLL